MVGNLFITEIPRSSDDCVGLQELHNAVQYPDVISVMADTSLLANVDLELLDTDYKKMAFFANVTNVMYCHTLLLYGLCQAESPMVQSMPNLIPLLSTLDDGSWFSCWTVRSHQVYISLCIQYLCMYWWHILYWCCYGKILCKLKDYSFVHVFTLFFCFQLHRYAILYIASQLTSPYIKAPLWFFIW